ncbi:VWA domain-containing protein [Cutibacterium equinum]|uniref:VWA domain-containing protein n=1 Tax=Cutibacterium equinum TaxID=3016342 RepID=A0ABY7QY82_9ACTN|nr:VWA domain-containing protein [Cutibacterium equinum]WCC79519.1 VWA domain-containing protein [Cutibacterium equinum]
MTVHPDWVLLVVAVLATLALAAIAVTTRRRSSPRSTAAMWCRVLAALLLVGVALRPGSADIPHSDEAAGAEVIVIVDRTTSMGATDHDGKSRMSGVTADLVSLADAMPSARVTVIASDNQARIALPPSTDPAALRTLAETLGWRETMNAAGSDIGMAEPLARQMLVKARDSRPTAKRYLVYMGDGEQTASSAPHSFSDISGLIDGGLVLGYGTTSGGTMPIRPGATEKVTRNGSPAVSHADPQALRTMAEQMGGRFLQRNAASKVTWWENPLQQPADPQPGRTRHWAWWFAAAALVCEMADAWLSVRAWRRMRKDVA